MNKGNVIYITKSKQMKQTNKKTTKKKAHRYSKQTDGCQRQEMVEGMGKVSKMDEEGQNIQTSSYNINKLW